MSLEERLKYADMKARHQNALRPWYKKWWGVLTLVILGLILIVAVVSGLYLNDQVKQILKEQKQTSLEQQQQNYLKIVNGVSSHYYLGAADAPVTIVEFGDFACPFCQQSAAGIRKVAAKYPAQVKIVWRDYPIVNENSIILSLAARCAGEQGKFWEFHDSLFSKQAELAAAVSSDAFGNQLDALAAGLNLSVGQFDECLSAGKYLEQINQDYQDGETLELTGTPTWFINDYYRIIGPLSENKLEELINGSIN